MFTHIYILTYSKEMTPIGIHDGCDIMTYAGVNIAMFKLAFFSIIINTLHGIGRA